MNAFIASLQFLTAIPLGKPQPFDPKGIVTHFPLAGLAIGLVLALFDLMVAALWPSLVTSALDVIFLAAITGALHLDGLADAADGLYGQHDREKALSIMKDSRVGAMGLVAVVCVLLAKTAAVGHIDHARFLALMLVPAYARSAMIVGMRVLPYARGREGTGSRFFETPLRPMDFKYLALPVFLSLFLGWRGLLLNVVFAVIVVALITCYRKALGGITGDLLGAMVEILEATLFLAVCVGGGP
jgi:adenosylcobinamide-GDP ribazoletransferase